MATPDASQNRPSHGADTHGADSHGLASSGAAGGAGSAATGGQSGYSAAQSSPGGVGSTRSGEAPGGGSSAGAAGATSGGAAGGTSAGAERQSDQSQGRSSASGTAGSSATRGGSGGTGMASDREQKIATSRESAPSSAASGGTGVSRQEQGRGLRGQSAGMNPFTLMRRLSEDMDRIFGDFPFSGFGILPSLSSPGRGSLNSLLGDIDRATWSPSVDVFQRGDDLVVHADLPGVSQDDISVEVNDGMLTLTGQRQQQHEENRGNVYRSERSYGSFYRVIPLPEEADLSQAKATFKDGVLEVTIPVPQRSRESRSRKLEIGH